MKNAGKALLLLVAGGIALFVCFRPFFSVRQALVTKDVEFVFVVTDEKTGEAVAEASIELRMEEILEIKAETIVTDKEGKARFFREKTGCEDVVQPFGQTITFVDRTWCEFSVRARGYRSMENASLAKFKYEDKGFFPEGRRQRVEFQIPLQPN